MARGATRGAHTADADALRRMKVRGASSPVLDARLRFTEVEGVARYVRMMAGVERVFPNYLPTQASGRWSTTNPPMTNFPPDCVNPECPRAGIEHSGGPTCWSARDTVGPDEGWWWLHWDLDAIEARVAAADSGDQDDLVAFRHGYDLHTITTCHTFKHVLPPLLTKALHTDLSCLAWRQSWDPVWSGADDRRRHIVKTMRYATLYCVSPKGVLAARDIEKLGLQPDELVQFAKAYLRSKPVLTACKQKVWDDCATKGVSYSWYGRRRRLYGDWSTRAKEGWSHRISATVTDYMNQALIAIDTEFPQSHLVLNSHDGATLAFPVSLSTDTVLAFARSYVERTVTSPTGHMVPVTASWERVGADLVRVALTATVQ